MKYRSKPTECEAERWRPTGPWPGDGMSADEIVAWVNANGGEAVYVDEPGKVFRAGRYPLVRHATTAISVHTINGWALAAPGHYVIMGSAWFHKDGTACDAVDHIPTPEQRCVDATRDFYLCDPETFEKRWEPMS